MLILSWLGLDARTLSLGIAATCWVLFILQNYDLAGQVVLEVCYGLSAVVIYFIWPVILLPAAIYLALALLAAVVAGIAWLLLQMYGLLTNAGHS